MSNNICLATNYMLMRPAVRQLWIDFDRHLEAFGTRLVLLTSGPPDEPLPFPVISIPYLLLEFPRAFAGIRAGGHVSPGDLELLQADSLRGNRGHNPNDALNGLFTCRKFLADLLDTLQPGYVLAWDPSLPISQILLSLAREAGLPAQGFERGLLPETLMIESRNTQGYSDLRTHWLAQEVSDSVLNPAAYERIRDYYLANKPQKYDQPAFGDGGDGLRQSLGLGGKKVVVFFGHYDACGLISKNSNLRRYHSPVYESTADALTAIGDILARDSNVAVIFKPHPIDTGTYAVANVQGIRVVRDLNVHALIDLADVVAAQFTSLQFEAALYDKPVVLLGRSAWWGRNAAYEVNSKGELVSALQAALARKNWPVKSANAQAFLTWAMEHFLIGCTDEVPARRTFRDFAKFIAETSLDTRHLPAIEDRWQMTEALIEQSRGLAKTAARPAAPELAIA
jgi:hypothetical protein